MKERRNTSVTGFISRVACCVLVWMLASIGTTLHAQPKGVRYRLPSGITQGDFMPSHVLVKLKPGHRDIFRGSSTPSVAALSGTTTARGVREMISAKADVAARSNKGPRRMSSTVDVGLYYRIYCAPGTNIEDFINDLYQTGHFDKVEPEFVDRLVFNPNDPLIGSQYYVSTLRGQQAWDLISNQTENITIAIVDSGGDLAHEDLAANIYNNPLDPPGNGDEDGNGFDDDYKGWDFVGNAVSNLNDPNFIGDNDPQLVPMLPTSNATHGVSVGGCASAVTNNAKGIAGIGYKAKLMFTKHSADNEPTGTSVYLGYDGILYAAERGADIINCSWGGPFKSEILQDLVNYVAVDLGILIVAAAGNASTEAEFFPAAYDNVLSVAGTQESNVRATFTNFGTWVDVSAPGVGIFTTNLTNPSNNYRSVQGTSFSSPIVAGVAALVKAQFPSYTPQQLAEQIRVSSDKASLNAANPSHIGKLGFGIVDAYAALTVASPAVRAQSAKLVNASGGPPQSGEKGFLTVTFKNLLASTSSGLEIVISENSSNVSVVKSTIRPGAIASGGSVTNTLLPFEIQLNASVPDNTKVPITITYTDGTYVDTQVLTFLVNPTYLNVDENLVTTTVSNRGRIGYEDVDSATPEKGVGFLYEGLPVLYEMGIMMGNGVGPALYNNVRSINQNFDNDFVSIGSRIAEIAPGLRSSSEVFGTISNSTNVAQQAFQLKYRSLAWKEAPYDKFVIMEYVVKNTTANALTNFYFGLFADWDVTLNGVADMARFDAPNRLGYVHPAGTSTLPYVGIQLLTGTPGYHAIDNQPVGGQIGLYDGFTDAEKLQSLNSPKLEAGVTAGGADVSHVVSSGPHTIVPGQEITIAFALLAAPTLAELQTAAENADIAYNDMLTAPMPVVPAGDACYDDNTTLNASGAGAFNWYKDFTGGTPFHSGSSFTTPNLLRDTTFYVSNADQPFESVRTPAAVTIHASPEVLTSGTTTICENESVIISATEADEYLWSNGATTQSIEVSTAGDYSVTVTSLIPSCQNTSDPVTVSVIPAPVADFAQAGPLQTYVPVQFTDESTDAISWEWDFGNGTTSTLQSPSVTYTNGNDYDISLTVEAANGCRDNTIQSISVITALEDDGSGLLQVYPNPTSGTVHVVLEDGYTGPRNFELTTLHGQSVYRRSGVVGNVELPLGDQPDGIYIVQVVSGNKVFHRKVVKNR